jgi:uncharacterized cupredoxin-like copper-binding protein
MIFFLIFIVILGGVMQVVTMRNGMRDLEINHRVSKPVLEPGEQFEIIVTFTNRSRFPIPFIRYVEPIPEGIDAESGNIKIEANYHGGKYAEGTIWLSPRQTIVKRIPVTAVKRGRYTLGRQVIYGGDFLGIKSVTETYVNFEEFVVYPKRESCADIDQVLGGFMGDLSVNRFIHEDPILTLGYREYTGREPMKMISWVQSARAGQLMVKKYDYTMEPTVSVIVAIQTIPGDVDLMEKTFSVARTVCENLEAKEIKYDFNMNAVNTGSVSTVCSVPDGTGSRHLYRALEGLGRAGQIGVYSTEKLLDKSVKNTTTPRGVVFIAPEAEPEALKLLERLVGRSGGTLCKLIMKEMAQ